jgi:hypothetical protein
LANAHHVIGQAKFFMGRAAETKGHILEPFRLSPRDISAYRWMQIVGVAKLHLGADAEAVGWLRRSIEANRNLPIARFQLAGALALLRSLDEARTAAQAGLALVPGFRRQVKRQSDLPCWARARLRGHAHCRGAGGVMSEMGQTRKW